MQVILPRLIVLLTPLLFYCSHGRCQFSDSIQYRFNYSLSSILNRTESTSSYVVNNNLRFSAQKKRVIFNLASAWIYGAQNKSLTNNDFTGSLDFNLYRFRSRQWYYWGLGTYESSYSLQINSRGQLGGGVAWTIIDSPRVFLNVSNGLLYEASDIGVDSLREQYQTVRNSFRLRFRFVIGKSVTWDGVGFVQNALTETDDYILRGSSNLSVKLNQWLSLTSALTYNFINRTRRENLLLTFGISVEKYF